MGEGMTDAFAALVKIGPSLASLAARLVGETEAAKRNTQLIEFQSSIIQFQALIATVQAENASLIRQKTDLEKEIERLQSRESESHRYKLVSPYSGMTVYALKQEMSKGEAAHYLCPNCFKAGKTSVLQITQDKDHWASFSCSLCKMAARTGLRAPSKPKYAEEIGAPK